MKKTILVMATLLCFPGLAGARNPDEKAMKKHADELTYVGQLKHAEEMLGKTATPSAPDDSWSMTSMMLAMFWGALGTGYFMYGKKQSRAGFLLCGIGLCVFPLLVSGNLTSLIIGLVLTIAPFKIDV
jgi:hypothetical protein